MKKPIWLNLGCGMDYKTGFINIDNDPHTKVDKKLDLNKKLPFKDGSVDYVWASHIFEHVENYDGLIAELYRVCKHEAVIDVRLPHFASPCAFDDDHKRFFTTQCMRKFIYKDMRIAWKTWSTCAGELWFVKSDVEITFCEGWNPLNYIGAWLFNKSDWWQKTFENTFLKYVFIPNHILFTLVVDKNINKQ